MTIKGKLVSVPRFIFVTGGVTSSLGKGITAASISMLLQARGFKTKTRKMDPYLNVDPGTMSPIEHGEVFVTRDGAETDLDLGHYERFTGVEADKMDSITTGRAMSSLIERERKGTYLGRTVQIIPHLTNVIIEHMSRKTDDYDFVVCEIGGTVGDIEALPFIESVRQIRYELGQNRVMCVHLTLLPWLSSAGELKTKPTQHSVKELRSFGVQPDMLVCRADRHIPVDHLRKIANFCNVPFDMVIRAEDKTDVYEIPLSYSENGIDSGILKHFNLQAPEADLKKWKSIVKILKEANCSVKIALVGKYTKLDDAYKSVTESLKHGGIANRTMVEIFMIDSENVENGNIKDLTNEVDGIIVPGGFGVRGAEGKMLIIKKAREENIPFFGICIGMQLAVIETAQNVCGLLGAGSSEFGNYDHKVVDIMHEWSKDNGVSVKKSSDRMGGTMRLGSYKCIINPNSKVFKIYGTTEIEERHRHRFEINPYYESIIEKSGMIFSGKSARGDLFEILEIPSLDWFIGTQFHPELRSKPLDPHPLFVSFIEAALKRKQKRDIKSKRSDSQTFYQS